MTDKPMEWRERLSKLFPMRLEYEKKVKHKKYLGVTELFDAKPIIEYFIEAELLRARIDELKLNLVDMDWCKQKKRIAELNAKLKELGEK